MARILKTRPVFRTLTFDGRQVVGSEITTDVPLAGAKETRHFAVDVAGNDNFPAYVVGFLTKADAKKFVTASGDVEFNGYNHGGDPVKNRRTGLGIPSAMVADFDGDESELAAKGKKDKPEVVTGGPAGSDTGTPSSADPSAVATAPHATRENSPAAQPGSDGSGTSSGGDNS